MFFKKNKSKAKELFDEEWALRDIQEKLQEVLDYKEELVKIGVEDLTRDQAVWIAAFKKGESLMAQATGDSKKEIIAENIAMLHTALKLYKNKS